MQSGDITFSFNVIICTKCYRLVEFHHFPCKPDITPNVAKIVFEFVDVSSNRL